MTLRFDAAAVGAGGGEPLDAARLDAARAAQEGRRFPASAAAALLVAEHGPGTGGAAAARARDLLLEGRALAVTTKDRFLALPDTPPIADVGVPGFDAAAWQAVVARAQTPPAIIAKLNFELNAAVALEDVKARIRDIGMNPVGTGTPEQLQQFFHAEIARWGKVIEEAGIAHSE